ncbi:MAG: hypothetical protein VCA17_01640 [Dehalococcoidia bacterium]
MKSGAIYQLAALFVCLLDSIVPWGSIWQSDELDLGEGYAQSDD